MVHAYCVSACVLPHFDTATTCVLAEVDKCSRGNSPGHNLAAKNNLLAHCLKTAIKS